MSKSTSAGPGQFVNQAYNLANDKCVIEFYQKWAQDYDHQMLQELGYTSPNTIACMLANHLPDKNSKIIDLGCGTGLTCAYLHQQAYTHLEGIDLSPDMLKVAENRNIYQATFISDLNQPLEFADESYDAAISSGTFTHGHVGPEPLDEIFRILKPGGILACTVHFDLWHSRGFETKFQSMVDSKKIKCLSLSEDKYYESGELEGWFCIYQKI